MSASAAPERLVTFERGGRAYALRAADVAEIASSRPGVAVPLTPGAVAGLVLERGRLLTVLDLDRLLRIRHGHEGPSFLIALAAPWANLALEVHAEVRLEDAGSREVEPERIDIARMVEAVEALIAAGGRRS